MSSQDWKTWTAASVSAGFGTALASIAPSTVLLWSGTLTTVLLGAIGLYQKLRQAKRAEDLADAQAFADVWKSKYNQAISDATYWQDRCDQAQKGSAEWERLYQASKPPPTGRDQH